MYLQDLSSNQKHVVSLAYYLLTVGLILAYIFEFVGPFILVPLVVLVLARGVWIWRFWVSDS